MSSVATRSGPETREQASASTHDDVARRSAKDVVTFPDLVRLHYLWRQGLDGDLLSGPTDARQRITDAYHRALDSFQDDNGPIINAYWCSEVESAVALTAKPPPMRGLLRRLKPETMRFHRVSDWATKQDPVVARLLHECDELSVRAAEVLGTKTKRICMQLLIASASHLLSLVDPPAAPDNAGKRKEAIELEERELAGTQRYYREAANAEAQMVYFRGMALGLVVLGAVVGAIVGILALAGVGGADEIYGALSAGAVGALVSVVARVNAGSFELDFDVDRRYTAFLGSLRPAIGAVFGLAMFFAISSGLLGIFKVPGSNPERLYFLYTISFMAGFSERWAQDTLTESVEQAPRLQGKRSRGRAGPPQPPQRAGADQAPAATTSA